MSKANRLKMYKKLKAEDRLSQDDGSLEKEFGVPKVEEKKIEQPKPKGRK